MRHRNRFLALSLASQALLLAACDKPLPPPAFANAGPTLRPETFFADRTHSWGVEQTAGGGPTQSLAVVSVGHATADGAFELDQTIRLGSHVQTRSWILRRRGAHGYDGSLTDASGPVHAEAYGNLFHLKYGMKGYVGMTMEQWLYLQPGGDEVLNEGVVSFLGAPLYRISELITRDTAAPQS
ncbi:MAG TPA: DUF3833 family protein [Caulobacteraceae bacterium]|jgi:hypothetical protein